MTKATIYYNKLSIDDGLFVIIGLLIVCHLKKCVLRMATH